MLYTRKASQNVPESVRLRSMSAVHLETREKSSKLFKRTAQQPIITASKP